MNQRAYYLNLREYLETLEQHRLLVRVTRPIDKDTELHPLVRLQYRGLPEEQRKAFIFENVVDGSGRRYDIPVAVACVAGSRAIYALGLRCSPEEIAERWAQAYARPIPPTAVSKGAVQEVVVEGELLDRQGLGLLPIPISTPGFDNAPYTSASQWVTKDPETGVFNMGVYRGQLKAPSRLGCHVTTPFHGLRLHWLRYRELGIREMPAAVVIGSPPHLTYAAVARVPVGVSEYDISGGLAGAPLEVVPCRTVDLAVPAEAEIVIEGVVPTDALEMEGPFGEYPGYMARRGAAFFLEVTCITHRRNPIYEAMLSQMPPSESSKIRQIAQEGVVRRVVEQELGMRGRLREVYFPESAGSFGVCVVSFKKEKPEEPMQILEALHRRRVVSKLAVIVDEDINPRDSDAVFWAVAYRMQPHRDLRITPGVASALDPSIVPPWAEKEAETSEKLEAEASVLLIDATRKWPYPPLSLPKREYMEKALGLWNELGLPELHLKEPWFGYPLGYWTEEQVEEANLAVQGRYYETGAKFQKSGRRKV
jgi:UbiD family decarboxylase